MQRFGASNWDIQSFLWSRVVSASNRKEKLRALDRYHEFRTEGVVSW